MKDRILGRQWHRWVMSALLVSVASTGWVRAEAPKKVKDGIEFSYSDSKASSVHLAGDFNNWAENQDGKVSRPEYMMKKDAGGVWKKTVKIGGGKHTYKFVVNGSQWVADPSVKEMDKDGNSILMVEGSAEAAPAMASSGGGASGPKKTAGGYEFSFRAPSAKSVHIAGDFNNWADNDGGKVSRPEHMMTKGSDGIWRKTVMMSPGKHMYKFVVDGSNWSPDPNNTAPRDKDDNSIVTAEAMEMGKAAASGSGASGPKKTAGGYEFSFRAPSAKSVHIAGDFNNWADNDGGKVSRPEHMMTKGSDGIWRKTVMMSPGKHMYKFVVDGSNWSPDPNNTEPRDKDDNSILNAESTGMGGGGGGSASGPKKSGDGYEFSFRAPSAKSVHIAGDFNNWADNDGGKVSRPEHMMTKGSDGIWRKTVKLSPGKHAYKFVIDGGNWSPDPNNAEPRDKDDNSTFEVK